MIERFLNYIENMIPSLIGAAIILIAGYFVTKLTLKLMTKGLTLKHVDTTIHKFLMSVVRVTFTIIIAVMALTVLKVPMTSIVTAIGTAGLAIGLALQDSLSNVAGGFIILFSKPFKCGDYISINGEEGTVDMISILYTRLLTIENKAVMIPNGTVSKSTIVNLTAEEKRRLELKFSISYSDDHHKAMDIIRNVITADSRILHEPDEPLIAMCEHQDSAVILLLRVWVPTEQYWDMRFKFIEEVKEQFDANGITIPFNQLDVHLPSAQ